MCENDIDVVPEDDIGGDATEDVVTVELAGFCDDKLSEVFDLVLPVNVNVWPLFDIVSRLATASTSLFIPPILSNSMSFTGVEVVGGKQYAES